MQISESDEQLVLRAQRRDAAAFADLIARHERTALGLAYATCRNAATASDVAQEAFLRAWQRLAELKEPHRFTAWLGRIVRNLATDALRRGKRPVEVLDERTEFAVASGRPPVDEPDAGLHRSELRNRIDAALDTLDELTRSAVVMRYFDDLSSKQIGELLELSPAAVDMRLSRARTQLREALSGLDWFDRAPDRESAPTAAGLQ